MLKCGEGKCTFHNCPISPDLSSFQRIWKDCSMRVVVEKENRGLTKIKCSNEGIFHICRFLVKGVCILEEVEMEYELDGPESCFHHMKCSNADEITNGSPEWNKYKDNRMER